MDSYIGNRPISQTAGYRSEFIATAGQAVFSVAYAVGYVDVFLNGVKLASGDFTATDGASVTLIEPATAGDVVAFIAWAKGTMVPKDEALWQGSAQFVSESAPTAGDGEDGDFWFQVEP